VKKENAAVVTVEELLGHAAELRHEGKTIAFANGCFDLIHVGHIRYIGGAAETADILVIGLNSDRSVRELKGEGRPYMPAGERAEILASLRGVDFVTVFDERSPASLIARLRPDVQCKGTDYTAESVPEAEVVASYGGRVMIVGDPKDHSTTELAQRLNEKK
jgi:D-glycero-beta-D-manno-heptose 1-phosphate adenylyltransferase